VNTADQHAVARLNDASHDFVGFCAPMAISSRKPSHFLRKLWPFIPSWTAFSYRTLRCGFKMLDWRDRRERRASARGCW
jgi:hypothetical protein